MIKQDKVINYLRLGYSIDMARAMAGMSRSEFDKVRKDSESFDFIIRTYTRKVRPSFYKYWSQDVIADCD